MAMKIAVVDDDVIFLEEFKSLVAQNHNDLAITVVPFSSSDSFLLSSLTKFDAFFLDIYIDAKDGISLAKAIHKEVDNPLIVFITSSSEKAVDAFALGAVHYLVKPLSLAKLDEALFRVQKELDDKEKKIVFENKDGMITLRLSDLIYIESFGNDKFFKLKDKTYSIRRSTQEILEMLHADPRFFLLSRSYIVNFAYVEGLKGDFLELRNGEKLPLPQDRKKEISNAFLTYLRS